MEEMALIQDRRASFRSHAPELKSPTKRQPRRFKLAGPDVPKLYTPPGVCPPRIHARAGRWVPKNRWPDREGGVSGRIKVLPVRVYSCLSLKRVRLNAEAPQGAEEAQRLERL